MVRVATTLQLQLPPHSPTRRSSRNKNSRVFQNHFCNLLALIPFLCFYFYPSFSSDDQTTPNKPAWPHSVELLAGLSHSSADDCFEEKLFPFLIQIFLVFPIFKGSRAKNIWGAIGRQRGCGGSSDSQANTEKSSETRPAELGSNCFVLHRCHFHFFAAVIGTLTVTLFVISSSFLLHSAGAGGFSLPEATVA